MMKILVIGGGPSGLEASLSASKAGANVSLIDNLPFLGGQIWKSSEGKIHPKVRYYLQLLSTEKVRILNRTQLLYIREKKAWVEEEGKAPVGLEFDKLIIAAGARELFLPFPGWTLPGVLGVGALQVLCKNGMNVNGKKILLSGTGPLVTAVAKHLRSSGAKLVAVLEQSSFINSLRLGGDLLAFPSKWKDLWEFGGEPLKRNFHFNSWVEKVETADNYQAGGPLKVSCLKNGKKTEYNCDYAGIAFGLIPNLELAKMLGLKTESGRIIANEFLQSTKPHIYVCGEQNGVGGADKALLEGRGAALSALDIEWPKKLLKNIRKHRKFQKSLALRFALKKKLLNLAGDEDIICRCEGIKLKELEAETSFRETKLSTRLGMGLCQGRICGSALDVMKGWSPGAPKYPLVPSSLETLCSISE